MNRDSSNQITRRAFLLAAGTGIYSTGTGTAAFVKAPGFVILSDETRAGASISLRRHWEGMLCRSDVINTDKAPVRVKEVVLFSFRHNLPGETRLYGEGFTMLSQTGGTLSRPEAIGAYTDAKHCRISQQAGTTAYYGMLLLSRRGRTGYCWASPPTGSFAASSSSGRASSMWWSTPRTWNWRPANGGSWRNSCAPPARTVNSYWPNWLPASPGITPPVCFQTAGRLVFRVHDVRPGRYRRHQNHGRTSPRQFGLHDETLAGAAIRPDR